MTIGLFVDCDETIQRTKLLDPNHPVVPDGMKPGNFMGKPYGTVARPSARSFLEAWASISLPVYVVTRGNPKFQEQTMGENGLLDLVAGVYSSCNIDELVLPDRWLLVDDIPLACHGSMGKLNWLGLDTSDYPNGDPKDEVESLFGQYYIQCQAFRPDWNAYDTEPLTVHVEEIRRRLTLSP